MTKFLFFFVFSFSVVCGAIVETQKFSDICSVIDENTLVLIDLDETTITSRTSLGSLLWWDHHKKFWAKVSVDTKTLNQFVNPIIRLIIDTVPQDPVEKTIPETILSLQNHGITIWGFTGRKKISPWDNQHDLTTANSLKNIGIDLAKSQIHKQIDCGTLACYPHFSYGILFANWEPKGPYLTEFLTRLKYIPSKVVVIDDTLGQIESVEKAMAEMNIPFVGFYYTKLKEKENKFDAAIGNIQLASLLQHGILLSDEEAAQIKTENPTRSPDFYLEELLLQIKQ
jgi:hypothetical protein